MVQINLRVSRTLLLASSLRHGVSDTDCVARSYCPGCEADADPIGQVLVVRWCVAHEPARDGADDGVLGLGSNSTVTVEAGGSDNQRWCALVHRDRTPTLPARSTRKRTKAGAPPGP
jgi:hypothetical protein